MARYERFTALDSLDPLKPNLFLCSALRTKRCGAGSTVGGDSIVPAFGSKPWGEAEELHLLEHDELNSSHDRLRQY